MKIAKTGLAAAVVLVFAVCSISPAPKARDLSNTVLTGQVLQMEDHYVTLDLGELTFLQTPETAVEPVRTHDAVPLGESVQTTASLDSRTFVSWGQDTVLDLSTAQVFSLTAAGQVQQAHLTDVAPQDIVSVAVGSDNLAAVVTILTEEEQTRAGSDALQGTAANTISENRNERGAEYVSASDDENALRVAAATVNLHNVRVEKSGGNTSSAYGSDRYGLNATLLATGGAQLTLSNGTISSSAADGNGVFSHGAGTMVYLNGGAVTTTGDGAGGMQTAGGAGIYAKGATVITAGDSAAVIRACSGGNGVQVDGGTYTSGGYDSPVIYATGILAARNADFTANNSQAVVMEGASHVSLDNCSVTGSMSDTQTEGEPCTVAILNSDTLPDGQQAQFSMSGGSLTARNGTVFYLQDSDCTIELKNVEISIQDSDVLLRAVNEDESHTAAISLIAEKQSLAGNILLDGTSALQLELKDNSHYTGAVQRISQTAEHPGTVTVSVAQGSTWSLTDNCVVDTLYNDGTIQYNGYTITLADGTVLGG